jgi:sodium pump decarboxylase gamma subunit
MQDWFVVLMGLVTVFVALILIIGLCYLLALICREKKEPEETEAPAQTPAIPNRGELAAAIGAAIAEYSGTDLSAIRILSIKKIEM